MGGAPAWLRYLLLAIVSLVFLAPFAWMLSTSLKPDADIFRSPPVWFPQHPRWENYPRALTAFPFLRYTFNTLVICALTVTGAVLSAALPAYGFSRIEWKGRDVLFVLMLATVMLPGQATMIPVFLIFRKLHWTGTILPLVVPSFFGSAFSIFLLRQFFLMTPRELGDAARIDGCGEMGILARIIVPLARPALATVALFTFMGAWTDYMGPLVYLHDERQYTLALGLQAFLGRYGADWSALMAAATAVTIPPVVLFLFTQKTFIEGIAVTGLTS
jgi:multiple sugar transport system permease protein